MSWVIRDWSRVCRFLLEANDTLIGIDLHHSKFFCFVRADSQRTNRKVGLHILVILNHRMIIHFVDMIASQNDQVLGALFFDGVDILVNGVGRPLIPVFIDPLLRWNNINKFIEFTAKEVSPTKVDMAIKTHGLVLRQDKHLAEAAIETIGEHEIDDAIVAAKRYGGLSPIAC